MSRKPIIYSIMLLCIISIFLIGTASAFELNETNDEILEINEISINEKEMAIDQSDSIATNHTPTNYNEIQNSIENSEEDDTIILDGHYYLKIQ